MNKRFKNLSECSDDEMVDILSAEILGDEVVDIDDEPMSVEITVNAQKDDKLLKLRLSQYIGLLRGMHLWYHAAHHVTRGTGFFGDHADLFGTLYNAIGEDVDNAIEKAIGLTNDEEMANPCSITELALQVLYKFPCPPTLTALALASTALEIEKAHNEFVSAVFNDLKSAGCLSLGLDDMLMATVNVHEGYIYKLQQRVKTELEN